MGSAGRSRSRSRSRSRDKSRRRERDDGHRRDRRDRDRSRSRDRGRERKERDRSRDRPVQEERRREEGYGLRVPDIKKEEGEGEVKEKEGINLGLSGALTKDVNTFNGIVIKYAEPPEARIPKRRWRFYVFKGEEAFGENLQLINEMSRRRGDAHPSHPSPVRLSDRKRQKGKKQELGTDHMTLSSAGL